MFRFSRYVLAALACISSTHVYAARSVVSAEGSLLRESQRNVSTLWDHWGVRLGAGISHLGVLGKDFAYIPFPDIHAHFYKSFYLNKERDLTIEFTLSPVHPAVHIGHVFNEKSRVSLGCGLTIMPLSVGDVPVSAPMSLHLGYDHFISDNWLFYARASYSYNSFRRGDLFVRESRTTGNSARAADSKFSVHSLSLIAGAGFKF